MPRSSQSETSSGSPPTYRTRFPIEIPFVTSQLVRVRESSIDETARNEISGCHSPLYFDSTDIWTVLLSLQIVVSEQSRVRYGPMLFDDLPEETCVQSRAETRASIAQDLEGRTGGARDRVVTGLHLGLP
jgi:hypothetical protein